MKIDFSGQVVLVTGATRGIGRRLAEDLGSLGAELILTATKKEELESLCEKEKAFRGVKVTSLGVNFLDRDSLKSFLHVLGRMDRIDVCINNAGINRINYLDETREEDWDDILTVNLTAPFTIMRAVSKLMKRHQYGRIVNVGSIFGVVSREKRSAYSASKFGLQGLTVSGSNELARHNILVNTVSPGFVQTDLTARILSELEIAELTEQIPARRFATPSDISRVIMFLASSMNTYLTGQNVIVDGGFVNV